jgi:hypothetical protein
VLTPYDFLSYALIVATVLAASSNRTTATVVFAAAAVATRESGALVVAIIAASCITSRPATGNARRANHPGWTPTWRAALHSRPLWAAAVGSLSTYATLKIAMRQTAHLTVLQHVELKSNLTGGSAWGIALAVGLLSAARWTTGPLRAEDRARRRLLWLLALQYLAVLFIGASWDEAPRLIMPLVIGETLLIIDARSTTGLTTRATPRGRRRFDAIRTRRPKAVGQSNDLT